jgi:IS30 family transposase
MKKYIQLSLEQRKQIAILAHTTRLSKIALKIGVHKSTVSRELKRNAHFYEVDHRKQKAIAREYADPLLLESIKALPDIEEKFEYVGRRAHRVQKDRRYWSNQKRTRKPKMLRSWIISKLKQGWTPKQISGRSKIDGPEPISHEAVYQIIKRDRNTGGTLHHLLPRFGRRKQRFNQREYKETIPDRVDIKNRPKTVEKRKRLGDLEGDLIQGHQFSGYVVVVVDRKSRQVALEKIKRKTKALVAEALIKCIKRFPTAHTLTLDNGREFSAHAKLTTQFDLKVYFATPYTSQEKGTVENTNGIIRRTLKKKMRFTSVNQKKIAKIESEMNNRPREVIGFLTPYEAAAIHLKTERNFVALRT